MKYLGANWYLHTIALTTSLIHVLIVNSSVTDVELWADFLYNTKQEGRKEAIKFHIVYLDIRLEYIQVVILLSPIFQVSTYDPSKYSSYFNREILQSIYWKKTIHNYSHIYIELVQS